jgi:hypothetical protein
MSLFILEYSSLLYSELLLYAVQQEMIYKDE